MAAFSDAIQDFFAAFANPQRHDFAAAVDGVLAASPHASPEELNWAAGPLIEMVVHTDLPSVALLGILGDLLCRGASSWGLIPHLLAGIRQHLSVAAEVERALAPHVPAGKKWKDLPADQARTLQDQLPEPARTHARSWNLLGFLLGPSMPVFEQVAPFRQLARGMGLDTAWLRTSVAEPDWLPHLTRILEERAAADGPLPDPNAALDAALARLRQVADSPPQAADSMQQTVAPLFGVTIFAPPDCFQRAAAELARIAADADPAWASQLASVCGAFVERGADPEPGADALLAGLPRLLDPTVAFLEACQARGVEEGESPLAKHAAAVGQEMPAQRRAVEAISSYCLGTLAHLARCPAVRKRYGSNRNLLARLAAVRWEVGDTGFLWKMLQVLEEELVILAPAYRAGWKVKIGGIGDNFQLHALIGGHLVGSRAEGKYPGIIGTPGGPEPPPGVPLSARALATQTDAPCTGQEPGFASGIQLWNWTALRKDGTLPDNPILASEHFVWNEGIPADIVPFEGTRVVLLGDSFVHRSWNGGRIFPFMSASFQVVETLSPEATGDWLGQIAARVG
jgi:hypothetical protein